MSKRQIWYFPYLSLGLNPFIQYDGITVWNLRLEKTKRIPDKDLRDFVSKLLVANRHQNKAIRDIGVVTTPGREDFGLLDAKEIEKVKDLRTVLFLATVAQSNVHGAAHFMATSENFSLFCQNFSLADKTTAYTTGRIVEIKSLGWKIGEIKYYRPRYVPTGPFKLDKELLNALQELKRKKPKQYRLIPSATDAMMNGYLNIDDQSYESRILEQCRSFEILFGLPFKDQKKILKQKIKKYCSEKGDPMVTFCSERGPKKKRERNRRQVMWADKFYTLRNHIIHGERIKDEDFKYREQRHWDLGLWFFLLSVKRIINEKLGNKIFFDTIKFKGGKFEYDNGLFLRAFEKAWEITNRNFSK